MFIQQPGADMTEALYLLSPPPRKQLLDVVIKSSDSLVKRLEKSREVSRRVDAEVRVGRKVLCWWRDLKKRKQIAHMLEFTTKAVKITKELHRLYDRSHESVGDDSSLAESMASQADEENFPDAPVEGLTVGGALLEQASAVSVSEST